MTLDISTPRCGHSMTGWPFVAMHPSECMGCQWTIEPGARAYRLLDTKDGYTVVLDYHEHCVHGPAAVSA